LSGPFVDARQQWDLEANEQADSADQCILKEKIALWPRAIDIEECDRPKTTHKAHQEFCQD